MTIPPHFQVMFSQEDIRERVKALALEINPWVEEASSRTGQQPLAVCVLRGATFFFADLLRAVPMTLEPTFCRTWSYSSGDNKQITGSAVRANVADVVAEGRALLVVDDICDTGRTLSKLSNVFRDLGASEVKTAVLIHRIVEDSSFTPDWSAFRHEGTEWFVGYGMEDKNHYANLPCVYAIQPPE